MATLIGSAKLSGVEPLAWLTDVLERIVAGNTKTNKIDSLMPCWELENPDHRTRHGVVPANQARDVIQTALTALLQQRPFAIWSGY